MPFPFPGRGGRPGTGGWPAGRDAGGGGGGGWPRPPTNDDRVNVAALRDMTDDSGGRTEIVRDARDLNPATANIADELSKQYYLGYPVQRARRTAAGTPSASRCENRTTASARGAATSRADDDLRRSAGLRRCRRNPQ